MRAVQFFEHIYQDAKKLEIKGINSSPYAVIIPQRRNTSTPKFIKVYKRG